MKQYFDDFTGTVLTPRGEVRFENGVLIKEKIMAEEKKYTGYGYHGGGRKRQGEEAKRTTVSFVCTPSEKIKLKELAEMPGFLNRKLSAKRFFHKNTPDCSGAFRFNSCFNSFNSVYRVRKESNSIIPS